MRRMNWKRYLGFLGGLVLLCILWILIQPILLAWSGDFILLFGVAWGGLATACLILAVSEILADWK